MFGIKKMANFKILTRIIFAMSLIQLSQPDQGEMEPKDNEWKQEAKSAIQETKGTDKLPSNKRTMSKMVTEWKTEGVQARDKAYTSLASKTSILDHFIDKKQIPNREIRSTKGFDNSLESQFERNCRSVGSQPCTFYYPDHTEVVHFEVGNDNITKNALMNGTGPSNCSDLKAIGHSLRGFYLVLLNNTKRAKPVYCDFNQTSNSSNQVAAPPLLNKNDVGASTPSRRLRFCGGLVGQECTFYYSDHPDAPQFQPKSNYTEPTSCEDLRSIGYSLNGYYMVRFNGIKVKTVYCNLNTPSIKKDESRKRSKRANEQKNNTKTRTTFCNGMGSQPCSCYHHRFAKILQLELSTDEITKNASRENGTAPTSCEDLETNGHRLKGFYAVRFNAKKMKTIFCEFNSLVKEVTQPSIYPTASTDSTLKSKMNEAPRGNEKSSDEKLLESENSKNSPYFEESEPSVEQGERISKTVINSIFKTMMEKKLADVNSSVSLPSQSSFASYALSTSSSPISVGTIKNKTSTNINSLVSLPSQSSFASYALSTSSSPISVGTIKNKTSTYVNSSVSLSSQSSFAPDAARASSFPVSVDKFKKKTSTILKSPLYFTSKRRLNLYTFTSQKPLIFNSSSITAPIKKEQQSSCIPLWHLKIGEPLNCLTVEHTTHFERPILIKCDYRNPSEQKWSMIESGNAEMRICPHKLEKCLTYDQQNIVGPIISLKKRDEEAKNQLFKMNIETSQIVIVESGSCVMGLFRSSPYYVSGLKVKGCNETTDSLTYKKWSVVPLKNCL